MEILNEENPRGYAYRFLQGSYNQLLQWGWFAAARAHDELYTENQYVYHGLDFFDAMATDIDIEDNEQVRNLCITIASELSKEMRATVRGYIRHTKIDGIERHVAAYAANLDEPIGMIDGSEVTLLDSIAWDDTGYDEVEDNLTLNARLRAISPLLREEDLRYITQYVSGDYDSLRQAVLGNGRSTTYYRSMKKRLRELGPELRSVYV